MPILTRAQEAFWGLVDPWQFMWLSATWLPDTVMSLFRERKFGILLSPSKLQEAWFSSFWGFAGPNQKINAEGRVMALLQGRTTRGRVVEEPVGPGIGGTVIEIGAGSGFWVDIFSNKHLDEDADGKTSGADLASQIMQKRNARKPVTRVYGVEPNRNQHASLCQKVKDAGLEHVYQIVPVGIEDLRKAAKVEKESVDCVVSILCLCSIPDPQHNFKELYAYLKKGGRWYVYEHVRADVSWGMRLYQAFVNLFWPHFLGGCQLCRPTEKWLREAGPWEKVDVGQPAEEQWHHTLPHILGVFTK